ncbi:MAG TPA: lipopolysaccharide kinase InaA family protein [Azoarcus taiwanensis]|nr:lipopolysaccharide kinase InaA family protein [Azoarcus taiwanensis]
MTEWKLTEHCPIAASQAFRDLDTVFELTGERIAAGPLNEMIRLEVDTCRYFVKRYTRPGKNPLRYWLGSPRVRNEWRNLQRFSDWGIPTASLIGYGLERRFGQFIRGALITSEIPDTIDLSRLLRTEPGYFRDRTRFSRLCHDLAGIVNSMHRRGFTHNDLHGRNVLYQLTTGQLFLIDCPNGSFWFGPLLTYRKVKDLACLDKFAKDHLSQSQRLRFFLAYVGHQRLQADDKRLLRAVFCAHKRRRIRKRLLP